MNPPPGWYPDPRDTSFRTYWDGQQWVFTSARNTLGTEIIGWVIGIALGMALCVVFPPAVVLVGIIALAWYLTNEKQKKLRGQPPQPPVQGPPR